LVFVTKEDDLLIGWRSIGSSLFSVVSEIQAKSSLVAVRRKYDMCHF